MRSSFACLIQGLDVRPLLKALETQSDLWNQITARQTTPGSPHVDTRAIFLRWAAAQTIEAVFNDIEAIDYPAFKNLPEARGLIGDVAAAVQASQIGRIMIASLEPGGWIRPHVDEGAYADHYDRFHLVLQSDFGNDFMCGGNPYQVCEMKTGEAWWFDHKQTHWVKNHSNRERIHLIMDMVTPLYRIDRCA
jgi:hypothetical protein